MPQFFGKYDSAMDHFPPLDHLRYAFVSSPSDSFFTVSNSLNEVKVRLPSAVPNIENQMQGT